MEVSTTCTRCNAAVEITHVSTAPPTRSKTRTTKARCPICSNIVYYSYNENNNPVIHLVLDVTEEQQLLSHLHELAQENNTDVHIEALEMLKRCMPESKHSRTMGLK